MNCNLEKAARYIGNIKGVFDFARSQPKNTAVIAFNRIIFEVGSLNPFAATVQQTEKSLKKTSPGSTLVEPSYGEIYIIKQKTANPSESRSIGFAVVDGSPITPVDITFTKR